MFKIKSSFSSRPTVISNVLLDILSYNIFIIIFAIDVFILIAEVIVYYVYTESLLKEESVKLVKSKLQLLSDFQKSLEKNGYTLDPGELETLLQKISDGQTQIQTKSFSQKYSSATGALPRHA